MFLEQARAVEPALPRPIVIDSSSPYRSELTKSNIENAVYMIGYDESLFGHVLAIVYPSQEAKATAADSQQQSSPASLSTLVIGPHGTSGFHNLTLNTHSRYFAACMALPQDRRNSRVRQALAISMLRSYATMNSLVRRRLFAMSPQPEAKMWDETVAGQVAAHMKLGNCRWPAEMGDMLLNIGALSAKQITTDLVDIIYEDSDYTINSNNELVYLFGTQLEQLFDPLAEYSPEPTQQLYSPPDPSVPPHEDSEQVQNICKELYHLQQNFCTELVDFAQEFLIPLRVKVLGGEMPTVGIRRLNTIFPPTIDEIVRINNLFYDALQAALPFGAFEVLKACGMTIPYFYRACMRHEAATKSFYNHLVHSGFASSSKYSPRKIESIIHCSLHLARVKLIIDRLLKTAVFTPAEQKQVADFEKAASGTIDSFARSASPEPYERRLFTPTGRILIEIASDWPKELEYGWMNRRVVSIFEAKDVFSGDTQVIVLFTDLVLILKAASEIRTETESGGHLPAISDILMHALINEQPLPANIPQLQVIYWAPIESVHMSEFNSSNNLSIFVPGSGLQSPSSRSPTFLRIFELQGNNQQAANYVNLLAKAKIMNKSQPFHLFKTEEVSNPFLTLYATVHEFQDYMHEERRTPIAIFMNMPISDSLLETNNLAGAFSVHLEGDYVRVQVMSRLRYDFDTTISKEMFAQFLSSEVAYLYTLYLSCANSAMVDSIIGANKSVSDYLVEFASTPSPQALDALQRQPQQTQKKALKEPKEPKEKIDKKQQRETNGNQLAVAKVRAPKTSTQPDTKTTKPAQNVTLEDSGKVTKDSNGNGGNKSRRSSVRDVLRRLSGASHLSFGSKRNSTFKFLKGKGSSPPKTPPEDISTPPNPPDNGVLTPPVSGHDGDSNSIHNTRSVSRSAPTSPNLTDLQAPSQGSLSISQPDQMASLQSLPVTDKNEQSRPFEFPPRLRRQRSFSREPASIQANNSETQIPSMKSVGTFQSSSRASFVTADEEFSQQQDSSGMDPDEIEMSSSEQDQRDVEAWLNTYDDRKEDSLSSSGASLDTSLDNDVTPRLGHNRDMSSSRDMHQLGNFDMTPERPESTSMSGLGLGIFDSEKSLAALVSENSHHSREKSDAETVTSLSTLEEDFSYLAGLVAYDAGVKEQSEHSREQSSSEAVSLYSGLRDSSIVFLGNFLQSSSASDRSVVRSSLSMKEESFRSGLSSSVSNRSSMSFASSSHRRALSHTNPRHSRYSSVNSLAASRRMSQMLNSSMMSESFSSFSISEADSASPNGAAMNRLLHKRSTQSLVQSLRQPQQQQSRRSYEPSRAHGATMSNASMLSNGSMGGTVPPSDSSESNESKRASFSYLLQYSSSNTLQLASFTVHLDRLTESECDLALSYTEGSKQRIVHEQNAYELVRTKNLMSTLYERTRGLMVLNRLTELQRANLILYEKEARQKVAIATWQFINIGWHSSQQDVYFGVLKSLLDMEWLRRAKLKEKFADNALIPHDLWVV